MVYLRSLRRCDASPLAAGPGCQQPGPCAGRAHRALSFWAVAEAQEWCKQGGGESTARLPSARLQTLLSVGKKDPPQKYGTKQTKVYLSREVCSQECTDQMEIRCEIWAKQGRNKELKILSSSSLTSTDGLHCWCASPQ